MALYSISDLHLSFYKDKPMDIFGDIWKEHYKKIEYNWNKNIKQEDIVLLPGDISWAKNMKEFEPDINFINNLSGTKIIMSGNHDYWWGSTSKLNDMFENIYFLKNNYFVYENKAICGTRGWLCPNDTYFTNHDEKIYIRETKRLILSLESALKAGYNDIIVMLHFPPTNDKKENSIFTDIIDDYNVKTVIYGHLHGEEYFDLSYKGIVNDVNYYFVSADYLNFNPVKIF